VYQCNKTYYWQVVAQDEQGNRTTGPLWHFTTGSDTSEINTFPMTPELLTPENGGSVDLENFVFSWHCDDPDGDRLHYILCVRLNSDNLEPYGRICYEDSYAPPHWTMRARMRDLLRQIYQLETAYRSQYGQYCLDGVCANYGQNAFAPLLDITIDSLNQYTYCMAAGPTAFTCTATANLDDDATIDTWTINESGDLVCTTDDFMLLCTAGETYYWRIIACDDYGHMTLSPIWSFTAGDN
jgi:hypothetical protein